MYSILPSIIATTIMMSFTVPASAEGDREIMFPSTPAIAQKATGETTFDFTLMGRFLGGAPLIEAPSLGESSRAGRIPAATSMRDGQSQLAPLAFVRFCHRFPAECRDGAMEAPIEMDEALWDLLEDVTVSVNRSIAARPEEIDDWAPGKKVGDCDAFAIEKRHRLIARGLPAAALSLTEVVARGEPHLVLSVRTDQGTYVLDNLTDRVLPWQRTGLRFVKMQSATSPNYWVAVGGSERPSVNLAQVRQRSGQRAEAGPKS